MTHDLAASVNPFQPPLKIDAGITSTNDLINTLTNPRDGGWVGPAAIAATIAIAMVVFQLGWTRRRAVAR